MKKRKLFLLMVVLCLGSVITSCDIAELKSETPTISNTTQEREATPTFQENQIRLADGMVMVFVPGGIFQMGSTQSEIEAAIGLCQEHYPICNRWYYERESPAHSVTLDDFWIDQTEISNAQYRLCVDAGICNEPTTCKKGEPTFDDPEKADHPVVCVNWEEAQQYCEWTGTRLPSEAEWEYAFRGEERLIYPWGNEFDGTRLNYCDQNCSQSHADNRFNDGFAKTAPTGSFPSGASWAGVLNMSGNVSEWVEDWYGEYPTEAVSNPSGPTTGNERMLKGCSWFYHPTYCRGAARPSVNPNTRFDYLGFRCASSDPQNVTEMNTSSAVTIIPTQESTVSQPQGEFELVDDELVFVNNGQFFEPDRSWDIALGDLDGDGDLDAVTTNDSAEGMKIWFNNGQGIFKLGDQKMEPSMSVILGDLEGDNDLDIVVTHWDIEASEWINGYGDASVWLNDGTGNFTKTQMGLGGNQVFNLSSGDLNSDGYLDIFFTTLGANTVWLNDGTGHFVDTGQYLETGTDAAVALGDVDMDGDLDALTGGWDGPSKVWLNNGAAIFTLYPQNITSTNLHIHGLSLGDLDNDGDLDAIAALANGGPHEVWFNDGTGLFEPFQALSAPFAHGVALGDMDGDGDLDAATAHGYNSGGYAKVWLNDGSGSFIDSQLKLGNSFSSAIALGDMDNDGDLDIFATHTQWQYQGDGESNKVWLNGKSEFPTSIPSTAVLGDHVIRPSDGMTLVYVPGNTFQMGSRENDPDATSVESPQYEVKLDSFWIDQTEITNAQYNLCVDSGECPPSRYASNSAYNRENYPAVGISWQDAADFCAWTGGRLPTEAEWEYVAKGPDGYHYPWGNTFDGNNLNYCDINCSEDWADLNFDDGYRESAPIGSYPGGASWVGALDMAGNVWELTGIGVRVTPPTRRSTPPDLRTGIAKLSEVALGPAHNPGSGQPIE